MTMRGIELLPEEVRKTLDSKGPVSAGEQLVRIAESLGRSQPGEALRWGSGLAKAQFENDVIAGCARWAAGVAMYLAGNVNAAGPELAEAARRLKNLNRHGLADRASLLLVDVHGERFDLDRARRLASRLHRSFTKRGDRERAAVVLANLAGAEDASDRVARARTLWRRARRDLSTGSLRRLLTDANLANVAALEGRFPEAAVTLQQIVDEARRQGMEGLARHAELNLAEVEFASGKVDRSFARWQRVIGEAEFSGDTTVAVAAGIDLARAEAVIGDISGARFHLERSLAAARVSGLDGETARAAYQLAILEAAEGVRGVFLRAETELRGPDLAVQRDLLLVDVGQLDPSCEPERLLRASRRLVRSGHLQRGRLGLTWAARRYLDRGHTKRARQLSEDVLSSRNLSPWTRMLAHHVLGRLGGRRAIRHLLAAVRHADGVHGRLGAAADRQAFLSVRGELYFDLLGALLERDRPADRRRALGIADRLRAGWLLDELARRTDRGDDEQVQRWQELRCRLAAMLHEVESAGEPRVRRAGLKLQGRIRALERSVRQAETELARRWPFAPGGSMYAAADALLKVLPKREVFVEYLLDDEDLVVFLVRDGALRVRVVPEIARELADLLASVQFHLEAATWLEDGRGRAQGAAFDARLRRLGQLLLDPVPLEGVRRLWIAPHGCLFHVPWAALEDPAGGRLLDRVPFTLAPGAGPAAMLLSEEVRRPDSMAVGGAAVETLPLVVREVHELARLFGGAEVAAATTREEFLSLVADHDLVHLAGHSLFLDGLPLASGLRMRDGYVTVHDLVGTRLSARYVSFGVCSGLRLGRDTGDRYAGFVLALMSGGVRTVVGPMAPVRDEVAYTFDLALHRTLRDTGDPQSAFLDAIDAVRELDPRPATWGSFHHWGDPRRWELA
jgi:hypothetical protein